MFALLPHKPTVPEVLPYVEHHYRKPGNTNGGALHIMLEDPNWDDHHAMSCLESALEGSEWWPTDDEVVGLALMLCCASRTQRKRLAELHTYPRMWHWRRPGNASDPPHWNGAPVTVGFAGYEAEDGSLFGGKPKPTPDCYLYTSDPPP